MITLYEKFPNFSDSHTKSIYLLYRNKKRINPLKSPLILNDVSINLYLYHISWHRQVKNNIFIYEFLFKFTLDIVIALDSWITRIPKTGNCYHAHYYSIYLII